jgi:hypothetical protein
MTEPENFIARWARRKRQAAEDQAAKEQAAEEQAAQEKDLPQAADLPSPSPAGVGSRPEGARGGVTGEENEVSSPPDTPRVSSSSLQGDVKQEPAFDLTHLPSIESITAETDIRAFLAPGVPADLTRAALRRVWAADPTIRDFKGLADYDWDFTTPGAIPGFGPLDMTDDLRRYVSDMVGRSLAPEPPPGVTPESVPPAADSSKELAAHEAERPQQSQPVAQVTPEVPVNNSDELQGSLEAGQPTKEYIAVQYSPDSNNIPQSTARRPHGRALPR